MPKTKTPSPAAASAARPGYRAPASPLPPGARRPPRAARGRAPARCTASCQWDWDCQQARAAAATGSRAVDVDGGSRDAADERRTSPRPLGGIMAPGEPWCMVSLCAYNIRSCKCAAGRPRARARTPGPPSSSHQPATSHQPPRAARPHALCPHQVPCAMYMYPRPCDL
jgi:hypothetical protein